MANVLRATVRSVDPQLPLAQVQSMERAVSDSGSSPPLQHRDHYGLCRRGSTGCRSSVFTASLRSRAALREQEMAIRIALGSQRSGILGFGLCRPRPNLQCRLRSGIAGAAAASHVLQSLLFGVSPFDPFVLALAAVLVLILALVAALLPARRAASIDPMKALRSD